MSFLRGTYYAPDTGNGSGGAPDTQTPAEPTGNGSGGAGSTGSPAATDAGRTFTQAEVDAMLGDRAKRASEASMKKMLEALGVSDLDTAKATLAEAEKLRQSQMSELEKAQKTAEKLQAELEAEKAAKADALAKAAETQLRSAVLAEAAAAGFHNPADAWLYIDREKLELTEGGEVKGAKAVVEAVAKERAYLLKPAGAAATPGSPRTQKGSQPAGATPEKAPIRLGF